MMSRLTVGFLFVTACLLVLSVHVEGSCSQFGHSCFGAHGKRNGGDQYQSLETAALYPAANQLPPFEIKTQDEGVSVDEPTVSNPEIIANVRNWLSILGRRLRQRSASQSAASAQNYGYLQ